MKTVEEIFNMPSIKEIEINLLDLEYGLEHRASMEDNNKSVIRKLLEMRKDLLDHEFMLNDEYKRLLVEFNDALSKQLIIMRNKMVKAYNAMRAGGVEGDIDLTGKCYLSYRYSRIHPIQTIRAKKIWDLLNECLDRYNKCYEDGAADFSGWMYSGKDFETENDVLYSMQEPHNWNEMFWGKGDTSDLMIIYPVHHLVQDTDFAIFDLLWVRDFDIEIHGESDYSTYDHDDGYDDGVDWNKIDYHEFL